MAFSDGHKSEHKNRHGHKAVVIITVMDCIEGFVPQFYLLGFETHLKWVPRVIYVIGWTHKYEVPSAH